LETVADLLYGTIAGLHEQLFEKAFGVTWLMAIDPTAVYALKGNAPMARATHNVFSVGMKGVKLVVFDTSVVDLSDRLDRTVVAIVVGVEEYEVADAERFQIGQLLPTVRGDHRPRRPRQYLVRPPGQAEVVLPGWIVGVALAQER